MADANINSHSHSNGGDPLDGDPLGELMIKLAANGGLAVAGQRAIAESFKLGLPVTLVENGKILRRFPDGREEIIGEVAKASYRLPDGVATIVNK